MTYGRLIYRSRSDSTARRLSYSEARQRLVSGEKLTYGPNGRRYRFAYKIGSDYVNVRQFSRLKQELAMIQIERMRRSHMVDVWVVPTITNLTRHASSDDAITAVHAVYPEAVPGGPISLNHYWFMVSDDIVAHAWPAEHAPGRAYWLRLKPRAETA